MTSTPSGLGPETSDSTQSGEDDARTAEGSLRATDWERLSLPVTQMETRRTRERSNRKSLVAFLALLVGAGVIGASAVYLSWHATESEVAKVTPPEPSAPVLAAVVPGGTHTPADRPAGEKAETASEPLPQTEARAAADPDDPAATADESAAVAPSAGATPEEIFTPVISVLDSRETISELQRLLAKLDFRPGPPDGVLGPRTVRAIRLYQQFAGIEADGRATETLLDDLRAVSGYMPNAVR